MIRMKSHRTVGMLALAAALALAACSGEKRSEDQPPAPTGEAANPKTAEKTADPMANIVKGEKPPPLAEGADRWTAIVQLPMQHIELVLDLQKTDNGSKGSLGVPAQKVWGIALSDVSYGDQEIAFTLDKPAMPQASERYVLTRAPAGGDLAKGTMTLKSQAFEVEMKRLPKGAEFKPAVVRPQTPKPPFPYSTHELTATNPKDGVVRAGILTVPKVGGPFPVVIIESGSGPQDRNGTFAGHQPYLVIADHLARNGIASLRTDDRGVGGSTGVDKDATYDDLTGDILALVAALKKRPSIAADKIGVMGHSQGGSIAPMAATRSSDVAFVIMLCGMGVPGDQVMYDQKRLILESMGVTGDRLAAIMKDQRKLLDLVRNDASVSELRKQAKQNVNTEVSAADRAKLGEAGVKQIIDTATEQMSATFIKELVKNQPESYLSRVKVPVLAIFGEKDLQVEPMSNKAGVEKALLAAKNPDVTTWVVPKMGHNLQETETGRIDEYGRLEQTVKPELMTRLVSWIGQRTGQSTGQATP